VSTPGDLLKANATVALGTLVSRITGFARFLLLLGLVTAELNDSFNMANNLPNSLYELVIGGVLTATLIPMFAEFADKRDDQATAAVVGTAMSAIVALTVLATLLSPVIIWLSTRRVPPGTDAAHYRSVTTLFGFLLFPQILFYGITFLASALLNARRRFRAAAWAPAINNILVILIIGSLRGRTTKTTVDAAYDSHAVIYTLGIASTLGIVAMAFMLWVALRSSGVRMSLRPDRRHPAVQRVLRLSTWTIGYTIANQISLWVMSQLAVGHSRGGWTIYLFAFLLLQLPIGLLAMSVTTTFGPELARARLAKDKIQLIERSHQGLRVLAALLLPVGAGLCVLARPLIAIMAERGQFAKEDPALLATTLAAFAVGLFSLGGYLFVLRVFYAHNDTRTPFALNVVENVINIVLGLILVGRYGVPGLAWSVTVAYTVTLLLALYSLNNKLNGIRLRELLGNLGRLALAAVLTGEVAWLASRYIGAETGGGAILRVAVGAIVGIAVYLGTLAFLKAPELSSVRTLGRG
jgi:putative peptidoglycan lipid II flippase